jgi:K+-transporting ATPase ATPase C chain
MKLLKQAVWLNVWLTILCGLLYPAVTTGLAQLMFPAKANGSLVSRGGAVVGSSLIGQNFTDAKWFHGRPSAAGAGYDALSSGGSNLGPTSKALMDRVDASVAAERKAAKRTGSVPGDLVTASGSGLDPDITLEAALWQAPSVAKARGAKEEQVRALVEKSVEGRTFGILGEPRVNVLKLNLALEAAR